MIKKVDILGIQLDNYTVREAIMCVERYLSNNVLNTIESISLQMLIDSETNPVLKEVMSSLDLAIIGEKEIIQAAGLESMHTQEKIDSLKAELAEDYPKLIFAGEYAVETCVGDLEAVINDMNATTPDVIISVLPSPMQEQFLYEHRDKMNANIWYGIGGVPVHKKKHGVLARLKSIIHRGKLVNSMNKYDEKEEEL